MNSKGDESHEGKQTYFPSLSWPSVRSAGSCGLPVAPIGESQTIETQPTPVTFEAATSTPTAASVNVSGYTIFPMNILNFSHPEQSATDLDNINTMYETYYLPMDIYLTDGWQRFTPSISRNHWNASRPHPWLPSHFTTALHAYSQIITIDSVCVT